MKTIHKLYSENKEKVNALLYNGEVIRGGENRNFKTAIGFNNNAIDENLSLKSFADISFDSFRTDELSVCFWFYPKDKSFDDSPILINKSNQKITGIFYNIGKSGNNEIGILWNSDETSEPINTGISVPNDTGWIHFIFVFNKEGICRIFGNGKYIKKIDFNQSLEKVTFSNLRVGGFSGWLDDFQIYHYPLKYGNVNIGQFGLKNIAFIFNTNRITGDLAIPVDINKIEQNQPFHYVQSKEYLKSHTNYNLQKEFNHEYYNDESMTPITGGVNEGDMRVADGSFRTFSGKIYDKPLKSE